MENIQKTTQRHYQRIHESKTARSISERSTQLLKPLVTPILTFKQHPLYTLNSPFSISNSNNQLTSIFAHPTLSKIHDSIDITLKIDRYTPSWLAVGLSTGQVKYEEKSQKHLLAISNGWMANRGNMEQSKVRFSGGDEVRIKWDKNMEIVEFSSKKNKETVRFENKWN